MVDLLPIILSASTFVSTLVGGWLAIRSQGRLRLLFAFGAGALLSISFVDLLPEAIEASEGDAWLRQLVYYTIIASFVLFHVVERYVMVHPHHAHDEDEKGGAHEHDEDHHTGGLGATGLIVHSFVDGIAIGAAFQAGTGIGAIVALAVIAHDFADGINTVTLTLRVSQEKRKAYLFLLADAVAPVAGAAATLLFAVPQAALALLLAFFVGHFLYIGASDLLPEMHRGERSFRALLAHLFGVGIIIALTRVLTL